MEQPGANWEERHQEKASPCKWGAGKPGRLEKTEPKSQLVPTGATQPRKTTTLLLWKSKQGALTGRHHKGKCKKGCQGSTVKRRDGTLKRVTSPWQGSTGKGKTRTNLSWERGSVEKGRSESRKFERFVRTRNKTTMPKKSSARSQLRSMNEHAKEWTWARPGSPNKECIKKRNRAGNAELGGK